MSAVVRVLDRRPAWLRALVALVLLAIAAIVPQLGSTFYVSLGLNFLIFGLLAMSLDLIGGYTGLVSLGQAAFLGVGAYGIAWGLKQGMSANASVGLALLAVVVTALVFGLAAVRVGGITFVILTLALGQIIWGLAYRWVSVSGGDNGLPISDRPGLGPIDLSGSTAYYYFVLVIFVICALILRAIVNSPFGLTLRGIKDNELRMRTLGYRVGLHKYLAFVISAFFAGVAGVLFGFFNLYISPTAIDFGHNGTVVLMAVLGGLGTLWGPLLGSLVIVFLQQYLSIYVQRWVTVQGVIFVLVVLFAPDGLWGLLTRLGRWLRGRAGAPPSVEPRLAERSVVGVYEDDLA
ncbi:MAG TPA: branched-chain amino acid ABC transporter permease [Candidatus Dormibacteraeota bacterium]|nr:branched-chain amino acid ABC transporter permease [Candidatus Dormibacteraeota bacterium]